VSSSRSPLVALQARLGYTFCDFALLERALTHSSYLPEHPEITESNQRLEFLGDAVLQLVLTETLFQLYPGDREGLLSKRRAALARGATLAELALALQLDACLRLGPSEETTGGRTRASSLEDAFEALIGALYLDSDLATARRILLARYGPLPDRLAAREGDDNPKGRLQECVQPLHGNHALRYEVTAVEGEDHARAYEVTVFLLDRALGRGRGTSKKIAEESAAREALKILKEDAGEPAP
jgi:ribonuclease-3